MISPNLPRLALAALAAIVLIQFIPVRRDNPPVTARIRAPEPLMKIFRRSCYDCHSHETRWPWYSRVAPTSWLVAHDVREGREELNFSTWEHLRPAKQADLKEKIHEVITEGEMPLWIYLVAHPDARLDKAEKSLILSWATGGEG